MLYLLAIFACSSEEDSFSDADKTEDVFIHPCFTESPILSVGEGEVEFEPFNENMEAMMHHGPQGGWHIELAFILENALDIVTIEYKILDVESGVFVSNNQYRMAMLMEEDCKGIVPGLYGYLTVRELMDGELDTPPELLAGHQLEIQLRINDCSSTAAEQGWCEEEERWIEENILVTAILDPIDIPE